MGSTCTDCAIKDHQIEKMLNTGNQQIATRDATITTLRERLRADIHCLERIAAHTRAHLETVERGGPQLRLIAHLMADEALTLARKELEAQQ